MSIPFTSSQRAARRRACSTLSWISPREASPLTRSPWAIFFEIDSGIRPLKYHSDPAPQAADIYISNILPVYGNLALNTRAPMVSLIRFSAALRNVDFPQPRRADQSRNLIDMNMKRYVMECVERTVVGVNMAGRQLAIRPLGGIFWRRRRCLSGRHWYRRDRV